MELLVGCDLATDLRQRTRLPLPEIDELVFQLGQGLASAHQAGVVHRDIKPQNLFVVRGAKPMWKVLDFGVSKLVVSSGTLTQGAAIGTPGYMAPEQAKGLEVDARADVFSFGAVVYRALTGQPAFRGPSQLTTMMEVIRSQPQRPGEFAEVPDDIDAVLALALAKEKEARFESANSFVVAWRDARRGALPVSLREAAKRILAAQPWGADLERDEATSIIARDG
jgi:serine/threonine-protein kinase